MDLNQDVNKMTVTERELPNVNRELKKIVSIYYSLARRSKLSEQDLDRMSEIWAKAEEDDRLSGWLDQIDFILSEYVSESDRSNPQCKNEQEKDRAEKDEELQYFLSEHIEVLATQKIKERELKKNHSNSLNYSKIIILCPDGSGYERVTFNDGETIEQWSKHKCSQCGHSYSEHLKIAQDRQDQTEESDVWYPKI